MENIDNKQLLEEDKKKTKIESSCAFKEKKNKKISLTFR